jgi:putative tryptophan/tyrosine transport system substrate-binding protein
MARARTAYSMSRRRLCWTLAGILAAPGIATGQAPRVRRIGVLEPGIPETPDAIWSQAKPLRELGLVEGQNLLVERRYGNEEREALQPLAEELVRARVDIIVTAGTPATLAAKHATTTIPIVFRYAGDAVRSGLVASLARPGGNVTGYSGESTELAGKQLSLLKDLLPQLRRVGVLEPVGNPYFRQLLRQFQQVCQSLGLEAVAVEITPASKIDAVIAELVRQHAEALVVPSQGAASQYRLEIFEIATKYGLPTMSNNDYMVQEGGALITYSPTSDEQDRIRAYHIDRILRGAKPADLPIRQPTKFVLIVNLKTARALGLTIPTELLLRADEVIR